MSNIINSDGLPEAIELNQWTLWTLYFFIHIYPWDSRKVNPHFRAREQEEGVCAGEYKSCWRVVRLTSITSRSLWTSFCPPTTPPSLSTPLKPSTSTRNVIGYLYMECNIFLNIWTLRWIDIWTWSTDWLGGERAGVGRGVHGPHPDRGQHRDQVCSLSCVVELQTKVREYFTITEKAPTMTFPWLKAPTSAFTMLNRH